MVELRVLTFNIAIGGDAVDLGQVVEAIRRSGAELVAIQEANGNLPRIAALLGWAHSDERHQVISRYPLAEPHDGRGSHLYVHLQPDRVVAIGSVHLAASPYGPHLLRDGASVADVEAVERATRGAEFAWYLDRWRPLLDAGVPLFVTGDFNVPSHTDWGEHAAGHRTTPVAWPVSVTATEFGLVDTYRAVHPDRPGVTWTHGFPHPRRDADELVDRIDFVWATADVELVDSRIVGPPGEPDVDIAVERWPSDHLGVVTTVRVAPVLPAPFVAVGSTRIERGDRLDVRFHAPGGEATDRIALVPVGGTLDQALAVLGPLEVQHMGQITFGTPWTAGVYDVVLASSGTELARTSFHVLDPGTEPTVTAVRREGELVVSWHAAPARKYDWVGVYRGRDPDLESGALARAYTRATVAGAVTLAVDEPGELTVRLLTDDSYIVMAEGHIAPS